MVTIVSLVAVAMHGIGHVLFLGPVIGLTGWGTANSWVLTGLVGDGVTRAIAAVVWTASGALFLTGVAGFVGEADWWRATMLAGAVISLIGTIAYWDGIKQPSGAAALLFNILVLGALIVARWPASAGLSS